MESDMGLSALQAGAYLHHLHLHSPDAKRLASFYADSMDMRAEPCGPDSWRTIGPGRRLLVSRGPVRTLAHAGFAVRDGEGLDGLRARAAAHGLEPRLAPTAFFEEGPSPSPIPTAIASSSGWRRGRASSRAGCADRSSI
jgi:catechol 2,3-dioxygenase